MFALRNRAKRRCFRFFKQALREKERSEREVPKFTESKTDRAYESFMQQIPGFQRDPPEAGIIQKDMKQKKQQKGAGKNDLPKR